MPALLARMLQFFRRKQFARLARSDIRPPADIDPITDPSGLASHVEGLRGELAGTSELCALHAATIVRIRRGHRLAWNRAAFFAMWRHQGPHLAATLNSRWLISAADTFADHGNATQRAQGAAIVGFFNMLRMWECERLATGGRGRLAMEDPAGHTPLWDGVVSSNLATGDVMMNTLARLDRAIRRNPALDLIFQTLLSRAVADDTALAHMVSANDLLASTFDTEGRYATKDRRRATRGWRRN